MNEKELEMTLKLDPEKDIVILLRKLLTMKKSGH